MLKRLVYAAPLALMITFGLFLVMQSLISIGHYKLNDDNDFNAVNFIRIKRQQELTREQTKPTKPPMPTQQPATNSQPASIPSQVNIKNFVVPAMPNMPELSIGTGIDFGIGAGDYMPIYRVAPQYPPKALKNRIEGWVIVEFSVSPQGTVKNPVVIDSSPKNVFDNVAINAVLKFRFTPRVINGEPIEVSGVRNKITFKLSK